MCASALVHSKQVDQNVTFLVGSSLEKKYVSKFQTRRIMSGTALGNHIIKRPPPE